MVVSVTNDLKVVSTADREGCYEPYTLAPGWLYTGVQQRVPGENETETYVHLLTHDQFEVCTMVIHDRSIDKCGKLVEGDVSTDEDVDASANTKKIGIHNTNNAKELFWIICMNFV